MLADHGGLRGEPGAWQVTPQASKLLGEVPGTLKDLILARFNSFPGELWRLIQKVAVIGSSFPLGLVQQFPDVAPDFIAEQLAELTARKFIVAEQIDHEEWYTFTHVLIQEALYGTLLKRDRAKIHTQIAQIIERHQFWPPDKQVEILAHHYAESNASARAIPYLITAANNAARRFAYETAIIHYRQATTLLPDQPAGSADTFFQVRLGLGLIQNHWQPGN